jgi:hypothetical protein
MNGLLIKTSNMEILSNKKEENEEEIFMREATTPTPETISINRIRRQLLEARDELARTLESEPVEPTSVRNLHLHEQVEMNGLLVKASDFELREIKDQINSLLERSGEYEGIREIIDGNEEEDYPF